MNDYALHQARHQLLDQRLRELVAMYTEAGNSQDCTVMDLMKWSAPRLPHSEHQAALDELLADWLMQAGFGRGRMPLPSKTALKELIEWSAAQVEAPTGSWGPPQGPPS